MKDLKDYAGRVVIVTGGRDSGVPFSSVAKVLETLRPVHLVLGCADGVDAHARTWAAQTRTNFTVLYAKWESLGKYAGPHRNNGMLNASIAICNATYGLGCDTVLVSFPGGDGTAHMLGAAKEWGVEILSFFHDGEMIGGTE